MKFDLFFTQFKKSLKISFTSQKIGICLYTKSKSTQKLKFSQVLKFVRKVWKYVRKVLNQLKLKFSEVLKICKKSA